MTKGIKFPQRPDTFHNYAECVSWQKKSVYAVVRGRKTDKNDENKILWTTIGTGFVVAPNRFVTAGHVINDLDQKKEELFRHQDDDKYFLLRHDDENNFHFHIFEPKINHQIFIYPNIDLAIIYLDDEFYQVDDKIVANKNDFIRVSKDFFPIGTEIGVLGYPLCKLEFKDHDVNQPKIGDILLRTDKGVINCRYKTSEKDCHYEFTLAFNPGNSGGPIFEMKSGRLVSIVSGYKAATINTIEQIISEEGTKQLKVYKEKAYIEALHATYSYGYATPSFIEVFRQHKITN
jgi:hypothetical protein